MFSAWRKQSQHSSKQLTVRTHKKKENKAGNSPLWTSILNGLHSREERGAKEEKKKKDVNINRTAEKRGMKSDCNIAKLAPMGEGCIGAEESEREREKNGTFCQNEQTL